LALTKTLTTKDFVDIHLRIPGEQYLNIRQVIENMLSLANIRYSIQSESPEIAEMVALEEVFPDLHPGSAIRGLRYREGLSQTKLAQQIGVKRRHISEMEHGKRAIGEELAKRLAKALHTDYKVFL